jgi:prophage regulatory protein
MDKDPRKNMYQSSRVLRWPAVHERVGICRSHAHALAAKNQFPNPIKLGNRASGWLESDITEWIEQRIKDSQPLSGGDNG